MVSQLGPPASPAKLVEPLANLVIEDLDLRQPGIGKHTESAALAQLFDDSDGKLLTQSAFGKVHERRIEIRLRTAAGQRLQQIITRKMYLHLRSSFQEVPP